MKNIFYKSTRNLIITSCIFLLINNFISCSKNNGVVNQDYFDEIESSMEENSIMYDAAPRMMKSKAVAMTNDALVTESAMAYNDFDNGSKDIIKEQFERKLIKNGNIGLQVNNLDIVEATVEKWCQSLGGYIQYSNRYENSCSFTVKIPCEKFDEAMEEAGTFGQVKNRGVSVRDVSDQYYDLQTRLSTKKILQTNLKSYLEKATNLSDILKIERELNNVTSEIESMEGQLKRLSNQIDFSTIDIYAELPQHQTVPGIHKPTFSEKMEDFIYNLKNFFGGLLKVILYGIICGIPCIAVIAFLFWLLFGKVGILKKLIKKLK